MDIELDNLVSLPGTDILEVDADFDVAFRHALLRVMEKPPGRVIAQ